MSRTLTVVLTGILMAAVAADVSALSPEAERAKAEELSRRLNIPWLALSDYLIEPATVRLVPKDFAERHQLIPINKKGGKLFVAMADPQDKKAIEEIGKRTGLLVRVVIAPSSEISEQLRFTYGLDSMEAELLRPGGKETGPARDK